MTPEQISREILINAPAERVWAAVTEAEHLGTWFGDAGATVDLRPGGELTLTWEEHGTGYAVIEKVEPHTFFSWRWAGPRGGKPSPGNETRVEFTLTPSGSGTVLRVVESGFPALDLPDGEAEKYATGNVEGWHSELDELREYLEK
jgi:uncharacterized protein YndB with AHSA1/START domain